MDWASALSRYYADFPLHQQPVADEAICAPPASWTPWAAAGAAAGSYARPHSFTLGRYMLLEGRAAVPCIDPRLEGRLRRHAVGRCKAVL